jgi:hypothetical protein
MRKRRQAAAATVREPLERFLSGVSPLKMGRVHLSPLLKQPPPNDNVSNDIAAIS